MVRCEIPEKETLVIEHLILDFNGTLAVDGVLVPGVPERLRDLSSRVTIHVITADTNGTARAQLAGLPCRVEIIGTRAQDQAKLAYGENLGLDCVAVVGNGRNDVLLLKNAALGIAVIQVEGAASGALSAARIICTGINDALDLLLRPHRLTATLRN